MNFIKTFFASLLAVVVGLGIIALIQTLIFVGMIVAMGSGSATHIERESVLRLNLGHIVDSPSGSPFDGINPLTMNFSVPSRTSLLDATRAIQAAATDDRIEGIYINFDGDTSVSLASLEELRAELVKFKESGKFIIAYQDYFSQIGYWFATVADRVYTNPAGGLQWTGLASELMFFKGLLDKLDIEPVVIRHGSFKSAVEPFINEKMSPENRLQYEKMTGSLWGEIVAGVSEARGIEVAALQHFADQLAVDSPGAAVELGLLDGLRYEDQVFAELRALAAGEPSELTLPADEEGKPEDKDPAIVSWGDYVGQLTPEKITSKNKIAVIYAEGEIVSGEGGSGKVADVPMVEKIRKARRDESVKAVVLRINSPGGSALASEVMWRELELLRAEKPLIVSMGALAASGGYYIAAPADAILADKTTLTGSIGVFGLFMNLAPALQKNLGVTFDVVKSNTYSNIGSGTHSPSAAELAYFQTGVEEVYTTFVNHVAEGRNMTTEAVDAIGQGRVWSGIDAEQIGLVDGFGGLVDALALAADRAAVGDDYRVWEVTATPTGIEALFAGFAAQVRTRVMQDELGPYWEHYNTVREMMESDEVQARLPFVVEIN